MDKPIITTGVVRDGKLKLRHAERVSRELKHWTRDAEVTVTIARKRATRSLAQNALYWSVYVEVLSEHTGYSPDEIHTILKAKFLPKALALCNGDGEVRDEFVIGSTTTTLNKNEFSEFLRNIQQWAAEELGVVIPDPVDDDGDPKTRTAYRAKAEATGGHG